MNGTQLISLLAEAFARGGTAMLEVIEEELDKGETLDKAYVEKLKARVAGNLPTLLKIVGIAKMGTRMNDALQQEAMNDNATKN